MHIASLVKIPCYLLKLSSRADNSVKIWPNLPISNSKPDLLNVNAYSKFGQHGNITLNIILNGDLNLPNEANIAIVEAVQRYIQRTKRF